MRDYAGKRDFERTPEPAAGPVGGENGPLRFCVQKHAARRLHYDLRMEWGGTLVCWAVPHGPSLNIEDKHLAVHVEDHPLEYLDFEGVIPKGQYGGGQMILWDRGIYSPDEGGLSFDNRAEAERRMASDFAKGKLSFTLRGQKLNGSWTLVKTTRNDTDWLLIKHQDEFATTTRDVLLEDRSVLSGLTVEDLRDGRSALPRADLSMLPGVATGKIGGVPAPMLCSEAERPFTHPDWQFEVKLDGIRVLAHVEDRRVRLYSRNGRDISSKFPTLVRELATMPHQAFVLDGEIVLYDAKGVPTFQGLMERFQLTNALDIERQEQVHPIEYCVFDLLHLDGWDLTGCALRDRRQALGDSNLRGATTRRLDAFPEIGELLFDKARAMGFEGVVGKRMDSKYTEGRRSPHWVKVKGSLSDDFLVVGYTEGEGSRRDTFGALVVAEYEDGNLVWSGNVGGGFKDDELKKIRRRLDAMEEGPCPFATAPDVDGKIHFVKPSLWVEVRYGARTREGHLRFPIFVRDRPDIPVMDETPVLAGPAQSENADDLLGQLDTAKGDAAITVGGVVIHFSNLDRVFWPTTEATPEVTKRDLARYFVKVAPHILPHLQDRPLSLVRCPDGIGGEHFFQKHWDKGVPEWVDRAPVWSEHNDRVVSYVTCNRLATLLWMAQMGVLEIHPWYSRWASGPEGLSLETSGEAAMDASCLSYPDFMVIDLDPNIPKDKEADAEVVKAGFKMAVDVALRFKGVLDELGLVGFLKTSGKTGLHIFVPIERNLTYGPVRAFCETLGHHMERLLPDKVTMEWVVKKRPEKVFFDHNQNVRGKTLAGLFSPRPVPGAPVSFPLTWARLKTVSPEQFTVFSTPGSLVSYGDPWTELGPRQDLRRFS